MVQVENESGLLSDSRDRNALAEAAWAAPVPSELLAHVRATPAGSTSARRLWESHGAAESGTWSEVFGDTPAAEEIFMAWAIATYVEHLAARGRAIADIPMYANAWLGPQPGQDTPGQYPSGGPTSTVLDVWRAAAPSLAFLGPDIYVHDADAAMRAVCHRHPALLRSREPAQSCRAGPRDRHVRRGRLVGVRARRREPRWTALRNPHVHRGARGRDRVRGAAREHRRHRLRARCRGREPEHRRHRHHGARGARAASADAARCRREHSRHRAGGAR